LHLIWSTLGVQLVSGLHITAPVKSENLGYADTRIRLALFSADSFRLQIRHYVRTGLPSNLRLDHPRHVVSGAIWQLPLKLPIEVDHSGNQHLRPFCFRDLDLDPMTFIFEVDQYPLVIYRKCENKLSTRRLSDIHAYIQTDTTNII